MKNFLLSIAIFLAVCIDGILIFEMSNNSMGTEIAIPEISVENTENSDILVPQQILVVPSSQTICYERWEYKPFQPVRNFMRFLHNNTPLRRLCPKRSYI